MKRLKNFLKYNYILLAIMTLTIFSVFNISNIKDRVQTNLYQGLKIIKITEEKIKINEKDLVINAVMPEIHYSKQEVERYINSYIRRNINNSINYERQKYQLSKNNLKINVNINYHIVFENKNLLNIVIYKEIKDKNNNFNQEKESYVFDLNTGQRIFLDNLLKDNQDYKEVIYNYIMNYVKENKIKINNNKIKIDKYTNYEIIDEGLNIYFNPYKTSKENIDYQFKIPLTIFKNKVKMIQTNSIIANIDTQTITKNDKYINSIINIPIIMIDNTDIEKNINDEITNSIMNFFNDTQNQSKEYNDVIGNEQNKFVANVNFDIKKNSNNMLSVLIKYYKYAGGAHIYYENEGYNIDIRNGKKLTFDSLFKEDVDYKNVINEEIRRQIEELIKSDQQNKGIYEFKSIKDNQKFYIQDDNLIVYFDLYEIAPYAAGIPEFIININKIDHMLKPEYKEIFK